MPQLEIRAKVQVIYYETPDQELGKFYATSEKRISIDEGHQILKDAEIDYTKLLKIQYENIDIGMTQSEFKESIKL